MTRRRLVSTLSGVLILSASALILSRADETVSDDKQLPVEHAECTAFGTGRDSMAANALRSLPSHRLSINTGQVVKAITNQAASRAKSFDQAKTLGTIDSYLFDAMQAQGVQPADLTTDWEFVRRVTLDLTGRIPTPARVLAFVADKSP